MRGPGGRLVIETCRLCDGVVNSKLVMSVGMTTPEHDTPLIWRSSVATDDVRRAIRMLAALSGEGDCLRAP